MSEWGELLDALRPESLEVVAGLERALAAWVEAGEQRCIDGQLVRAREALSIALHEMGATAIPGLHLPQ
jgi:hypothetical protein